MENRVAGVTPDINVGDMVDLLTGCLARVNPYDYRRLRFVYGLLCDLDASGFSHVRFDGVWARVRVRATVLARRLIHCTPFPCSNSSINNLAVQQGNQRARRA